MTEMQSVQIEREKINRPDKFAMDKWKKHQGTFPLRGHCWRAALLAVFRLIVVSFVSGGKPGVAPNDHHGLAPQS